MAFSTNTARNTNNNAQSDSWKADGFLNLYLPNREGKRTKLGAIALKTSKANEKRLFDWLKEDPARAETLLAQLQIEFRTSEPTEGSAFALPI